MVFVVGLLFQATTPFASMFVALSHNVSTTSLGPEYPVIIHYGYGLRDLCMVFFYFLICIVMDEIIQEYLLDKVNRKLHLSKVKHSKFNESGQLLTFYLVSMLWGGHIAMQENYVVNISKLWQNYPHHEMTFMFKFFFIIQMCYWLHCYPELYFRKTKREEMGARIQYATLYLVFFSGAYLLNFTRVALCLAVVHYLVECVFHLSRLLYFADKTEAANLGFMVWNVLFVLVRLGSIILSVLTFWYGLALTDSPALDIPTGNFNTHLVRINCLVAVCLLQAWMMWNFITFHLRRLREKAALAASTSNKKKPAPRKEKGKSKDTKRNSEEDIDELTEVDQNTRKNLRARGTAASGGKHRK